MRTDALTGKGTKVGQTGRHRHSGAWAMKAPGTQKIWHPNLHTTTIKIDGASKKIKVATKTLRMIKELGSTMTRAEAKAFGII
jgi:ribosomal protein L28